MPPKSQKKKRRLDCFDAAYDRYDFLQRHYQGYRLVPLAKIRGTVGRCNTMDLDYEPVRRTSKMQRYRYKRIKDLVDDRATLPPVELYRLGDEYYVVDGHHRVRAAKEIGKIDIDAYVTEFLPEGEGEAERLMRERHVFETHSRLANIELSQTGQYPRLLEQIRDHHVLMNAEAGQEGKPKFEIAVEEAARHWRRTEFKPVVRMIVERGLHEHVSGATPDDLYLWAWDRRRFEKSNNGGGASWEDVLDYFVRLFPEPTAMEGLKDRLWPLTRHLRKAFPSLEPQESCDFVFEASTGSWYCRSHQQPESDSATVAAECRGDLASVRGSDPTVLVSDA